MITGAHIMIYSHDAEADRAFFRDILGLDNVDAGYGWLIFRLPPSDVALHPSHDNDLHEVSLMCDDIESEIDRLSRAGVECTPIQEQGWGRLTRLHLPGGGSLALYQPTHPRP